MADMAVAAGITAPKSDPFGLVNAVQTIKQGQLQIQAGELNNRLLGQSVDSKIALGQAITGATDEKTGKTDWTKAASTLAQDPKGSFAMPEFSKAMLERALSENSVTVAQLETTKKKLTTVADFALGALANGTTTKQALIDGIKTNLFDSGLLGQDDLPMAASFIQQLGDDPAQNKRAVMRLYTQLHTGAEGISATLGTWANVDTGPTTTPMRTSPVTGETQVATGLAKNLSPSQLAQTVEVMDPVTKQPKKVTLGSLLGQTVGSPDAPINTTGVVTGQAPGAAEAQRGVSAASVAQATALQQRAGIVPSRRAALSNIIGTLTDFTPGPKADLTYAIGALATQFGLAPPSVTKGVAAQDEFNKLAAQIALDQWGSLGGSGSNEQLATTMKANPNTIMSTGGIKGVVALLQGNEDAISAQYDAWQKYSKTNGAESYGDFIAAWNKYYDPRVFQAQHMKPTAVKEMLGKMTDAERQKYYRDQSIAKQAGWIK